MSEEQPVTQSGVTTRRALLVGAGAVGTTAVLAACGTDPDEDTSSSGGTQSNGGSDPSAGAGDQGGDSGGGALTQTSKVPVGGGTIIAASSVVVTQPTEGEFKCFDSQCTHQGCPVTAVEGGTINCSCHGSKFSIADGSVKGGPATKPLAEKQIKVDGDNITLA
ncbi:Rieske (2Fe-2S) protein [Phytohabitans sp. ZYX-F-186]|uniref:Cytochrome bc1 complex Rieske iron-sulfur subunit n=1 Tax=Phytohabitans maris TaxID=3071409 RepID=A0ABU0ZAX5_9ACTN|nr:Rieske (2Fe-2S) protein [Phytohabitans sp. ZYX-F-186]MDQ7904216.1 Rieske (2Fe-2S) protein [Phytohabitans sp. ZYX-F-186]